MAASVCVCFSTIYLLSFPLLNKKKNLVKHEKKHNSETDSTGRRRRRRRFISVLIWLPYHNMIGWDYGACGLFFLWELFFFFVFFSSCFYLIVSRRCLFERNMYIYVYRRCRISIYIYFDSYTYKNIYKYSSDELYMECVVNVGWHGWHFHVSDRRQ